MSISSTCLEALMRKIQKLVKEEEKQPGLLWSRGKSRFHGSIEVGQCPSHVDIRRGADEPRCGTTRCTLAAAQ